MRYVCSIVNMKKLGIKRDDLSLNEVFYVTKTLFLVQIYDRLKIHPFVVTNNITYLSKYIAFLSLELCDYKVMLFFCFSFECVFCCASALTYDKRKDVSA